MPCRHCHKRVESRPRGLCGACYADASVRRLYPPVTVKYGLSEEECAAIPTQDTLPAVPVETWSQRRARSPHDPKPSAPAWVPKWTRVGGPLTEDTEPGAIARKQRRDVRACVRRGVTDPEQISALVVLPVSIVKRRMGELGHKGE